MRISLTWSSKALALATIITIILPKATVRSQAACSTDFMESGAWEYENSSPVTLNMTSPTVMTKYCGISHMMWMELAMVRVNWSDLSPESDMDRAMV